MAKLFIPILQGTTRQERKSIFVSKLIEKLGEENEEIEVQLIDPLDFNFPNDGNDEYNKDPRYTEITQRADGFVIVVPEYNHSFPGTLKRMLDSELRNYVHKPVAFAGVSSGSWGGVRGIESLVNPVREMGLAATFTDVQFPKVEELFDGEGNLQDEKYIKRVNKMFDELIWMAKALKHGRDGFPTSNHPAPCDDKNCPDCKEF